MNDKIDRLRLDNVDKFAVSSLFVSMEGAGYERKKFVPVSEVSHLERYQYTLGSEKITLVYDTKAKILTIDAKTNVIEGVKKFVPPSRPPVDYKPREIVVTKKAVKPADNSKMKKPATAHKSKDGHVIKPKPVPNAPLVDPTEPPLIKKAPDKPKPEIKPAAPVKPAPAPAAAEAKPAEKTHDSLSIKSFAKNRLDWCLNMIKELPDVRVKESKAPGDKNDSIYQITSGQGKLTMVYTKNQTMTMQGKPGKLFEDIKAILSSKSDLRVLRKNLPTGIRYLSEPSRIDLSNGINDLAGNVRLSDYSVLLIAPYRALEKLIYDLQQAEGINVKMIGQAYEKDDAGKYTLKRGYIKRIGSVVYSEVMSSLYTEYSAIRNFYTHSDNSAESQSRGISNKTDAQNILKKLLGVIEYNSKKLSEIGFNIENNQ